MYLSNPSTHRALDRRTVEEIRGKIVRQSGRNRFSRFVRARNDKDMIASWRSDLNGILMVFNVCAICPGLAAVNSPHFRLS